MLNTNRLLPLGLVSTVLTGTALFTTPAIAADQVKFQYKDTVVALTQQDLEQFTKTGVLPDTLQTLLNTDKQLPESVRTLLTREIKIPKFVEKLLDSSTGEFLLLRMDSAISGTNPGTQEDLNALKSAFNASINDDKKLSFLEVINRYPGSTIQVNLTNLEGIYNRTSNFIERVQPALAVAKSYMQDLVCDCNTKQAVQPTSSSLESNTAAAVPTSVAASCQETKSLTEATETEPSPSKQAAVEPALPTSKFDVLVSGTR